MANNNNSNMSTSNFISSIGRGVQRHAYKIQLNKAYKNKPEEANKILANYNKKVAENVKWRRNNPLLAYMKNHSDAYNNNNNTMAVESFEIISYITFRLVLFFNSHVDPTIEQHSFHTLT